MESYSQNKLEYSSGSNRSIHKPLNVTSTQVQAQPIKDLQKCDKSDKKSLNIGDRVVHLKNNKPEYAVIKSMHPTSDKSMHVGVEFVSKEMYKLF